MLAPGFRPAAELPAKPHPQDAPYSPKLARDTHRLKKCEEDAGDPTIVGGRACATLHEAHGLGQGGQTRNVCKVVKENEMCFTSGPYVHEAEFGFDHYVVAGARGEGAALPVASYRGVD